MPERMTYNHRHKDAPANAINIDRRSNWGNPYRMSANRSREEAVALYRDWLRMQIGRGLLDPEEIRGKPRVCWCWPLPCHSDVIGEFLGETDA